MSKLNWKYLLYLSPILLILAGYRLLKPVNSENMELLKNIVRYSGSSNSEESINARLLVLRSRIKQVESDISRLVSDMPKDDRLSVVYNEIGKLSKEYGIELVRLIPEPVIDEQQYSVLVVTVTFSSGFHRLVRFVHDLERTPLMIRPDGLKIVKEEQLKDNLTCELRLTTYLEKNETDTE